MSVSRLAPASLVLLAAFAAPAFAQQNVVVNCESVGGRQQYCEVETRYGVRLVDDLSRGRCREGSTWGADGRGIWVTGGCRGAFELGAGDQPYAGAFERDVRPYDDRYQQDPGYAGAGAGAYAGPTVLCESKDNRRRHCRADVRGGRVVLIRNVSRTPCAEGHNWGWDDAGVWVDQGCRGEFAVESGGGYARYGQAPYGGGGRQGHRARALRVARLSPHVLRRGRRRRAGRAGQRRGVHRRPHLGLRRPAHLGRPGLRRRLRDRALALRHPPCWQSAARIAAASPCSDGQSLDARARVRVRGGEFRRRLAAAAAMRSHSGTDSPALKHAAAASIRPT